VLALQPADVPLEVCRPFLEAALFPGLARQITRPRVGDDLLVSRGRAGLSPQLLNLGRQFSRPLRAGCAGPPHRPHFALGPRQAPVQIGQGVRSVR
jgi:hypothetical protein